MTNISAEQRAAVQWELDCAYREYHDIVTNPEHPDSGVVYYEARGQFFTAGLRLANAYYQAVQQGILPSAPSGGRSTPPSGRR